MWWEFFSFEIKYRLGQVSTYIFGLILFAFGFLLVNIIGGAFSDATVVVMSGGERLYLNSAFVNSMFMDNISIFLIFIIAAFVSSMLSRDLENKVYPLFFTKPINKLSYLSARFFANILLIAVFNLMLMLGMFIAYYMPWLESDYFMTPQIMHYITPVTHLILPNIILLGALLLSVYLLTKKSAYVYVAAFFILTAYLVGRSYIGHLADRVFASLIDPFGVNALREVTRLWPIAQRNSQALPFTGLFMWNRIIWLAISLLILSGCVMKFRLSWIINDNSRTKKVKARKRQRPSTEERIVPSLKFSLTAQIRQFLSLLNFNLKSIFKSFPLYLITICGVAFMILIVMQHGTVYNTRTLPVTYNVAEALGFSISLLLMVIITLYTGELVWKSKDHRYNQIIDSTPIKSISFYLSQITSLVILQVFLFSVFVIAGLIYQTVKGYTEYELSTYFKILLGINLPQYIIASVLCFFIHTVVSNKYTGHFIFIAFYILLPFASQVGIHHMLLQFNSTPTVVFSDMNGLGNNLTGYIWFTVYWGLFAILLAYFTVLIWKRGQVSYNLKQLWSVLRRPQRYSVALIILSAFLVTGGYIFYNTNMLNNYMSPKQAERLAAEFERQFSQYSDLIQPKITDVSINVDIFPDTRNIIYTGTYTLRNKSDKLIQQIHVMLPQAGKANKLGFNRDHTLVEEDETFGYHIFELGEALAPNESIQLEFDVELITRGFSLSENQFINKNGTFIHSTYFPSLGYNERHEIDSPRTRRRYGLPEKERFREIDDPQGLARNYISNDADWITFEAVISTSETQTALTSGDLIRNWTDEGRNYYHYKLDGVMINYYAILSAEYEVQRESYNDIDLEIYYDSKHHYNIDNMMNGVKKSLAYYENAYGQYPHRVLRIAEFPRYGSFAQALATLIPFSESVGFIAEIRDDKVDYPFMITAHEVAHQWWAHQLIGANIKGALTLAEAITQYSALMVMKNEFSEEVFREQLRYDLTRYLSGRSSESREENPVYLDDGQQYIHYSKGAMVFYGLSQYLGEQKLNNSLKRFLEDKRYQEPPYTTTVELFEYIDIPDSLEYLFADSFKKITLYENRIKEATKEQNGDGTYTVTVDISTLKYYSDGLGNNERVELEDWIEVVVYGQVFAGGKSINHPIYREFVLFTEEETELTITVDSNPVMIGLDPDFKLIDLMPYHNTYTLK
jgi:ABC-2 type transport system permease protein